MLTGELSCMWTGLVRPKTVLGTYANSADPVQMPQMRHLNRVDTICLQEFLGKMQ